MTLDLNFSFLLLLLCFKNWRFPFSAFVSRKFNVTYVRIGQTTPSFTTRHIKHDISIVVFSFLGDDGPGEQGRGVQTI